MPAEYGNCGFGFYAWVKQEARESAVVLAAGVNTVPVSQCLQPHLVTFSQLQQSEVGRLIYVLAVQRIPSPQLPCPVNHQGSAHRPVAHSDVVSTPGGGKDLLGNKPTLKAERTCSTLSPGEPLGPRGPRPPLGPLSPLSPAIPLPPGDPGGPLAPVSPFPPESPDSPLSPFLPSVPFIPRGPSHLSGQGAHVHPHVLSRLSHLVNTRLEVLVHLSDPLSRLSLEDP
ncbi:hypothetical protein INR49_012960 [Caranx melampygus]|nr:hypothetical protein INR49_012960 [Caranx melampygus]